MSATLSGFGMGFRDVPTNPSRAPAPLRRRFLTNLVLERLETTGQPVGDAVSPAKGGWQGQPNVDGSNFVPYVVAMPAAASVSGGPLADTQADWQCPYTLTSFGVSREQCEWMADLARDAAVTFAREVVMLNGDGYMVQQARATVIGPIQRVDATEPAYYGQTDSVTLWISKELSCG